MSDTAYAPPVRAALVNANGTTSPEFYRFFQDISTLIYRQTASVDALTVRVKALEDDAPTDPMEWSILGNQSIVVAGMPSDGLVMLFLQGDVDSAPERSFYGAMIEGEKGWQRFSANFETLDQGDGTYTLDLADLADSGTGSLLAITRDAKGRITGTRDATITGTAGRVTVANGDASDGLPTIDLATVADAGGGALLRFVRDAWGRLTGTSAATTTDLTEGSNLYYTDGRADARITLQKGQPSGLASLDSDGKLDAGQLPALAITETFVVASQAAMLALTAQEGDVAVRTDLSQSFILTAAPASTLANWQELLTPASPVTSVFGRVGSVTAASGDYTFAQIASTPTTLAGYGITDAQAFITAGTAAQYWRGDKTWQTLNAAAVGLGNVNNTADTAKPVSTAQAAADALRVLKAGDTMTGPLVLPGDPASALQAAPKQYVDSRAVSPTPVLITAAAETFLTAAGGETSAPLTIGGVPLSGTPTVAAIHRTDWQGRQLLYATARTQLLLQTELFSSATWGKGAVSAAVSTDKIGLTGPYFWTVTRTSAGGSALSQGFIPLPGIGNTTVARIWIRAGASSQIQVGINNSATGTSYACTARIVTGPGSVAAATVPFAPTVNGLSTTQDTCIEVSRVQPATDTGTLAIFVYPNNVTGATGDSVLVGAPNVFNGVLAGAYIGATTSAVTVTDYTLSGSNVAFGQTATAGAVYDWNGSGYPQYPAAFNGPVQIGTYTLTTLPSASAFNGYLIVVSNATAGPALCLSNGTDWIDIRTNAAVS